jgi:phospholipid transport system transporter-binding protein
MIACENGRCIVEGAIHFANVVALLERGQALFTAPEVTVDLARVTEVDSSAVSLLLEWQRAAERGGRGIRFVNLPENLQSLARLYGVDGLLNQA